MILEYREGRRDFSWQAYQNLDLRGAKLSGIDFTSGDLTKCDCTGADFSNSNFRSSAIGSKFAGTDFTNTGLRSACLMDCDLTCANFTNADLAHADLSDTVLTDADFTGANLTDVDLRGAKDIPFPHASMYFEEYEWQVIIIPGQIQIGCQIHPVEDWERFTQDEIKEMSPDGPVFWAKNKETILEAAHDCQN